MCGLRKNKLGVPATTKRLPAVKTSSTKSNNYSVMPLAFMERKNQIGQLQIQ
jgi:hypothetical protein